jgi:predicted alpha/beta hydrolase family esterase
MARRFLFLHGIGGRSLDYPEHWQSWLAARLRADGHFVSLPRLPGGEHPSLAAWTVALDDELTQLAAGAGERVVLCQSTGGILWLHNARAVQPEQRVDRVLLVAPPCATSGDPRLDSFFPVPLDPAAVAAAAGSTRLICSDNDPWCPEGADAVYAEPLHLDVEVIPGAEHVDDESGYGPWPHLEAWCLGLRPGIAS